MGLLITLVILVPVILLLLQASILTRSAEQRRLLESLYEQVKYLRDDMSSLSRQMNRPQPEIAVEPVFKDAPVKPIIPEEPEIIQPLPSFIAPEPVIVQEPVIPDEPVIPEPVLVPVIEETETHFIFTEAHPRNLEEKKSGDLEKYIGENVANKIGIAVLVLGISFFVKYAIDKDWINEAGRVLIGFVSGTILIGLAHRYRLRYRSFSSVLVGGGLTVYYFSVAFAFHQYHLVGQTTAFISMIAVSGFAVILSLWYDRLELAVLATIGAFITPFLVSTGEENHVALFSYICIINAGLIALALFKRWPSINVIALSFTTLIFGSWLIRNFYFVTNDPLPKQDALLFASLFYLQFVAMNIVNSIRLKNKFNGFDFILLPGINSLYYIAGMAILSYWNEGRYQGIFTASLGAFNLLLTWIFHRKKEVDRNFVFLLIGMSLTFISLFAPVELKGHHTTLFWLSESLVLLFLFQRTKTDLLKITSLLLSGLALFSLLLVWVKGYMNNTALMPVIINRGFITSITVGIGLLIYNRMLSREQDHFFVSYISTVNARKTLSITATIIFYLAGVLELYYQFNTRFEQAPVYSLFVVAYSFIFTMLLLQVHRKSPGLALLRITLTLFCLGLYLFTITTHLRVSESLILSGNGKAFFLPNWIATGLLFWMLAGLVRLIFRDKAWKNYQALLTWVPVTGIVILLSVEMYQFMLWTNPLEREARAWWENLYYKAGLSILWGICSFAMMWLGMKYSFRALRIISLTLFTITLVKLFVYDIRNIPPGGKIAAFILLGCLLLIVSFMYQRLKRMIIDPDTAGEKDTP